MTKITFNTSRQYTALGQVVTAHVLDDRVLFKDHSRLICGEITSTPLSEDVDVIAHWVMARYDKNEYRMSTEAINLEQSDTIHKFRI
ncbi:hypothetical protein IB276_33080 [Ensifer sp. ENS04]|uniref:hypothetical protein n=1 Tax=Ensifer sp. ENS04 TaxID=2769281 RepID=UPI00177D089C|nr:hypothetical protein [Ensifer sp. ENS04]MBD9544281.1 hypothetical protein [Ensifer sp. ENS04]